MCDSGVHFAAQPRNDPRATCDGYVSQRRRENDHASRDLTFCPVPSSTQLMRMKRPFEEIVAEHGPTVLRVCRALLARPRCRRRLVGDLSCCAAPIQTSPTAPMSRLGWSRSPTTRQLTCSVPRPAGRRRWRKSRRAAPPPMPWNQQTTACGRPASLPTKQRQAVAYHHVGGLPQGGAALLGGSTDAARRAAHDGIRALAATTATPNPTRGKGSPLMINS